MSGGRAPVPACQKQNLSNKKAKAGSDVEHTNEFDNLKSNGKCKSLNLTSLVLNLSTGCADLEGRAASS